MRNWDGLMRDKKIRQMMCEQKLLERMWDVLQIEVAQPWRFLSFYIRLTECI